MTYEPIPGPALWVEVVISAVYAPLEGLEPAYYEGQSVPWVVGQERDRFADGPADMISDILDFAASAARLHVREVWVPAVTATGGRTHFARYREGRGGCLHCGRPPHWQALCHVSYRTDVEPLDELGALVDCQNCLKEAARRREWAAVADI